MNNDPFNPNGTQDANNQPVQPPVFEPVQPITPQQQPATPFAQPITTPVAPIAQQPNPVATDPGKGFGIAGIILAFFAALIGLILSIVSLVKSKKAGFKGTLGLIGIILSAIMMVVGTVLIFLMVFVALPALQNAQRELQDRASSSVTRPTTDTDSSTSTTTPDSSNSTTEAARLNSLGTVADATLQQSIIGYISIIPGTDASISSKDVVAIRSTQVNANTFDEEWDVKNGTTTTTFLVHMVAAATGGVDFSVTEKK